MCIRDSVVAVRVPAKAIIAAHAQPSARAQNPPRTLGTAVERFLVSIDHDLRQAKLRPELDARLFKIQRGNHGRVALQQQLERFVIHEGTVFDRIVSSAQRVLDACLLYTSDAADERSSVDLGG